MTMTLRGILLAAGLAAALAGAASARAASLCEAELCAIRLDFPAGGAIDTPAGATITFGSGGLLQLGDGGVFEPGSGGSITPAPVAGQPPDMSGGGTIVLGEGGALRFGAQGLLDTAGQGQLQLADGSELWVRSARFATIHASAAARFGRIASAGTVHLEGESISDGDHSTPIHFTMAPGDTGSRFELVAAGPLRFESLESAGMIELHGGGGDLHFNQLPTSPGVSAGGSASAGLTAIAGTLTIGDGLYDGALITVGGISIEPVMLSPMLSPTLIGPITITPVEGGVLVPAPVVLAPQVIVIDPLSQLLTSRYPRAAPADEPAGSMPRAAMAGAEGAGGGAFPALFLLLLGGLRYAARRPRR